jgi:uncharacterized protein (DUF305 family)
MGRQKASSIVMGLAGLALGALLMAAARPSGNPGLSGAPTGGPSAALDSHFIEQMIPHHQDAVAMAELALTKAKHPELKRLAEDIRREQTREIGEMRSWYAAWFGKDVPASDGADSHGHGMMGQGTMMGMMGDHTDLETLETAADFDREFIRQMIPHHQMAVMMARMLRYGTARQEMKDLADAVTESQSAEIELMRGWYRDWSQESP